MVDIRMSKSKALEYNDCPRRFYFKNCTSFGRDRCKPTPVMERGTMLHELFEAYNTNKEKFDKYFAFLIGDEWYEENVFGFFSNLNTFGLDKATYSELDVYDPVKNLRGIIDAVYTREGDNGTEYILIDYKSGKYKSYKYEDYLFEMYIYEYLANVYFGEKKVTHIGMFFTSSPENSFIVPVDDKTRKRKMKKYDKICEKIANNEFECKTTYCKWCQFASICDDYADTIIGKMNDHVLMAI